MKFIATVPFLLLCSPVFAALGDNAPSIPSAWVAAHPRMPYPTNAQLLAAWNSGSLPAKWVAAANSLDGNCVAAPCTEQNMRYALLGYAAAKAGGATLTNSPYSTWKTNLLLLAGLGGLWGPVITRDATASANSTGCTTSCNLTDASIDFTTACAGGSCAGYIIGWQGLQFVINAVNVGANIHAVTLNEVQPGYPYPWPNGSSQAIVLYNVQGGIINSGRNPSSTQAAHAWLTDWFWNDMTPAQQAAAVRASGNHCIVDEQDWVDMQVSSPYSPYNDIFYLHSLSIGQMYAGVVVYPDLGLEGANHLRAVMDLQQNYLLPTWKQIGGWWHEAWNDYFASAKLAHNAYFVAGLLPYAYASGRGKLFFTVDYPWLKNFAYWPIYQSRPDLQEEWFSDSNNEFNVPEEDVCTNGEAWGMLPGMAAIYNDPVLRYWARKMDNVCPSTNPNEPTAFPYMDPDVPANTATSPAAANLSLQYKSDGFGVINLRTGWAENDTSLWFRYGDWFWSKPRGGVGDFRIYSSGALASRSGAYTGTGGTNLEFYGRSTQAINSLTVTDSSDTYPGQLFTTQNYDDGSAICRNLPNDGGERRIGSGYQNYWNDAACDVKAHLYAGDAPTDPWEWIRKREWYHAGILRAWSPGPAWTYFSVDLTRAYTRATQGVDSNGETLTVPNANDRTQRVNTFTRDVVFIPAVVGTHHGAYVIVKDYVAAANSSFPKKVSVHSINQPTIAGNQYTILRTENVRSLYGGDASALWPNGWTGNMLPLLAKANSATPSGDLSGVGCGASGCYQYNGKLVGRVFSSPSAPGLAPVGGANHEFDIAGTNYPLCSVNGGLCSGVNTLWGTGNTGGEIHPDPNAGGIEPASWRVEITPGTSQTVDYFVNMMWASDNGDTRTQTSITQIDTPTTTGVSWTETNVNGACAYAVTFNKIGVGGSVTATGAGCANAI